MAALRILVLSHHFPPEVSAGASRIHEMASAWVKAGHQVTVVTGAPNHPAGKLYPGYRNRLWQRERIDGIEVIRLWTSIAPNKGFLRRTLNYFSYLASATLAAPFLPQADIVISTSPQFFGGLAGYPVSRWQRKPWVLEIRDLWPESIVAVQAMKPGLGTRLLQRLERFAYRRASHIVSASRAFLPHFEQCGIEASKISVVTNGVDLRLFAQAGDAGAFREQHGLEGKFVAAYIGTHGMAHQLEVVLEAAGLLRHRSDIAIVMVGDGAERRRLLEMRGSLRLTNVVMLPQMPRSDIPQAWAACDAAIVTLRPTPVFELVIPSKMFEAMAMRKPIVLGVRGEAQRIVEDATCGLTFPPGHAAELAARVVALADDRALGARLGENGFRLVTTTYDRDALARNYLDLLARIANRAAAAQARVASS